MNREETWRTLLDLGIVTGEMVRAWRRLGFDLSHSNLSGADLSGADLTGVCFTKANLSRMDLSGASLAGAVLSGADLSDADLTRADLTHAELSGANLTGADLSRANLANANLTGVNLTGAILSGTDLTYSTFLSANLTNANLEGVNLTHARLSKVIDDEFVFPAILSGANLTGVNLTGNSLSGANLAGANLAGANLAGANVSGADLTDADLTASVLLNADFTGAILNGICIDDANLSKWIIKDVVCTHILQKKSGAEHIVSLDPLEFEKRFAQLETIAELVLNIPLNASSSLIAEFIAQSINKVKGSTVVTLKGFEALSNSDTKMSFMVWDSTGDIKKMIETTTKNALNDYFKKSDLALREADIFSDPVAGATDDIIAIKDKIDIPGIPLVINSRVIENKALEYFVRMGKAGEEIFQIVSSLFR